MNSNGLHPCGQINRQLPVVVEDMGKADIDELVKAAGLLAERDCVALLGAAGARAILVASVGPTGLSKGIKAGDIIKAAAAPLGGGGGGRLELAQGGGPKAEALAEALAAGMAAVRKRG